MKKTLLAVLATALIGGVVATPTIAAADEYPGTVATTTQAGGPHKMTVGKKPKSSCSRAMGSSR